MAFASESCVHFSPKRIEQLINKKLLCNFLIRVVDFQLPSSSVSCSKTSLRTILNNNIVRNDACSLLICQFYRICLIKNTSYKIPRN